MKKALACFLTALIVLALPAIVIAQQEQQQKPLRGCQACHVKRSEQQDFSLFGEIKDLKDHPKKANGKEMDENTKMPTCQICHATNNQTGKGVKAPIDMASIVHPAHAFSNIFTEELNGDCFSCHTVTKTGGFGVISEKIEVDKKGITENRPIKTVKSSYKGPVFLGLSMTIWLWIALGVTALIAIIALIVAIFKK